MTRRVVGAALLHEALACFDRRQDDAGLALVARAQRDFGVPHEGGRPVEMVALVEAAWKLRERGVPAESDAAIVRALRAFGGSPDSRARRYVLAAAQEQADHALVAGDADRAAALVRTLSDAVTHPDDAPDARQAVFAMAINLQSDADDERSRALLDHLRAAVEADEHASLSEWGKIVHHQALVQRRLGREDEATALWDELVARFPEAVDRPEAADDDAGPWVWHALAALSRGRSRRGRAGEALALLPPDPERYLDDDDGRLREVALDVLSARLTVECQEQAGAARRTARLMAHAVLGRRPIATRMDGWIGESTAERLHLHGFVDEAIEVLDALAQDAARSDDPDVRDVAVRATIRRAVALSRLGRMAEAQAAFEDVVQHGRDALPVLEDLERQGAARGTQEGLCRAAMAVAGQVAALAEAGDFDAGFHALDRLSRYTDSVPFAAWLQELLREELREEQEERAQDADAPS